MQKLPNNRLVIYHDPPNEAFSDAPVKLFVFATHDEALSNLVSSVPQNEDGQVIDNKKIIERLIFLTEKQPKSIDSFQIATSINEILDKILQQCDADQGSHICIHIIPTQKTIKELTLQDNKTFGYNTTKTLIEDSLKKCETFFLSHLAQQMRLAELFLASAVTYKDDFKYQRAYNMICYGRKIIYAKEAKEFYSKKSAKILEAMGLELMQIAHEKPEPVTVCSAIMQQATNNFNAALLFNTECNNDRGIAQCHRNLAKVFNSYANFCKPESKKSVQNQTRISAEAALIYYNTQNDKIAIKELNDLISPPEKPINTNTKPIDDIILCSSQTMKRYLENPKSISTEELKGRLDSIHKVIKHTTEGSKTASNCFYELVKIHNALAERTNDPQQAKAHLMEAIKCLKLIDFGANPRTEDLVNAGICNMRGKIYQKQGERTLAINHLKQAKALYNKHGITNAAAAIDLLLAKIPSEKKGSRLEF